MRCSASRSSTSRRGSLGRGRARCSGTATAGASSHRSPPRGARRSCGRSSTSSRVFEKSGFGKRLCNTLGEPERCQIPKRGVCPGVAMALLRPRHFASASRLLRHQSASGQLYGYGPAWFQVGTKYRCRRCGTMTLSSHSLPQSMKSPSSYPPSRSSIMPAACTESQQRPSQRPRGSGVRVHLAG